MSNYKNKHAGKKSGINDKETVKQPLWREVLDYVIVVISALVIAAVLDLFVVVNAVIPSASMEPTIMSNDRIFGNRLAYIKDTPKRGDIIIFRYPDNEKELFIKRVIGLPGETLEVKGGKVYINGSDTPLKEDYIAEECAEDFDKISIPQGSYFVMGDNRNNSRDSRYWINHFVYEDKILGRALIRYYPKISKIPESEPVY